MKQISELRIDQSQRKSLSSNLKKLLDEKRITESDLARELGLPLMTIRRLVSGETTDPRLSTLRTISDYFNVSLDSLIEENPLSQISTVNKNNPKFIPIIDWNLAGDFSKIDLSAIKNWHPLFSSDQNEIGENPFAIESRPSMHPRFPIGTLFIINPDISPIDGDLILIKLKSNGELTIRQLVIDPPKWQLLPIVSTSESLTYNDKEHIIVGVIVLTMLYTRNDRNK